VHVGVCGGVCVGVWVGGCVHAGMADTVLDPYCNMCIVTNSCSNWHIDAVALVLL